MEVELKLLIAPEHVEALRQHPLLRACAQSVPHEQEQRDTYFDTPERHLLRAGAGLRVRHVGQQFVQTLKGGGENLAGLHSRHEYETPVGGPAPELERLRGEVKPHSSWARLLRSALVEDTLAPVFSTTVLRTSWNLLLPRGAVVECALDEGSIEGAGQAVAVSELELELKSGDPVELFDFALAVQADVPLRLGLASKAERGYRLHAPAPAQARRAEPVALSRKMSVEQAFKAIAANCLSQIHANEACVEEGRDPEGVHQMRVGLRRLRSALTLFKRALRLPGMERDDLGWLGEQLGAARDWDVLCLTTLPQLQDVLPDAADADAGNRHHADLLAAAQDQAAAHRDIAAAAVGSPRFARLLLSCTRWLLAAGWRVRATPRQRSRQSMPARKFAHEVLAQRHRELLSRLREIGDGKPKSRHRIRIAAKQCRYAAEFFHDYLPPKRAQRYAEAMTALQDRLGQENDALVATGLLREFSGAAQPVAQAAAFAGGYLAARLKLAAAKPKAIEACIPARRLLR